MQHKSFKLLVLAAMALSLAACGGTTSSIGSSGNSASTSTGTSASTPSISSPSTPVISSPSTPSISSPSTPSVSSPSTPVTSSPSSPSTPSTPSTSIVEETSHLVTISQGEGYTATLDKADGKYEEGDLVTISVTITGQYKLLDSISSEEVTISTPVLENGVYTATFTMIDEAVNVTVTLKDQTFSVGKTEVIGAQAIAQIKSVEFSTDGSTFVESMPAVAYNQEVTAKVTFSYSISAGNMEYYQFYVDNIGYEITADESTKNESGSYVNYTGGLVTFKMPGNNVSTSLVAIYNSFADDTVTDYITVSSEKNEYVNFYGYITGKKYSRISLSAYVKAGYSVEKWEYTDDNGETWNEMSMYQSYDGSYSVTLTASEIEGTDVVLRATGEFLGVRTINYVNDTAIRVTGSSSVLPSEVTVGESVTIYYTSNTGFAITGPATIDGVAAENITENSTSIISFIMPDNDVTITFNVSEYGKLSYTPNENITSVEFKNASYAYDTITSAAPGSTVYAFVTVADGYKLLGGSVNGGEEISVTSDYYGEYIYFTMPSDGSDAVVTFTLGTTYLVSSEENENASITFGYSDKTTYAAEGETVEFNVRPNDVFTHIDSVTSDDESLEITFGQNEYGDYVGSFVMPDHAVVLSVTTSPIESQTLTLDLGEHEDVITSISIRGSSSSAMLGNSYGPTGAIIVTEGEFLPGESINISLSATLNSSYDPTLYVVKSVDGSSVEEALTPVSTNVSGSSKYLSYTSLTLTDDITGFIVKYTEKVSTSITVDDAGYEGITYTVNNTTKYESVEELNQNLHIGDTVTVNTPSEEGYKYIVTVSDEAGETISVSNNSFQVTKDGLTVKIAKEETYSFTINDGSYYSLSYYVRDDAYNSYSGYGNEISLGLVLHISISNYYSSNTYQITIKNGDEVITDTIGNNETFTQDITVKGNVLIETTVVE